MVVEHLNNVLSFRPSLVSPDSHDVRNYDPVPEFAWNHAAFSDVVAQFRHRDISG